MEVTIKDLRRDGLLLKSVPSKDKTEQMCKAAVKQNPAALKFVPLRLQTEEICKIALKQDPSSFQYILKGALSESICRYAVMHDGLLLEQIDSEYKTDKVYRAAVNNNLESLRFIHPVKRDLLFPRANYELVERCLILLKEKISEAVYLPMCLITDFRIYRYLLMQGCIDIRNSYYDKLTHVFYSKAFFNRLFLLKHCLDPENYRNLIIAEFYSFEEFYYALGNCLDQVDLSGYDFKNIDLHKYNISGAVIDSSILLRQGLYDAAYFEEIVLHNSNQNLDPETDETALEETDRVMDPAATADGFLFFDRDKIPIFYISDIHLTHRVLNKFSSLLHATKEEKFEKFEKFEYIRSIARSLLSSCGTIIEPRKYLLIAGDTSLRFEFIQVFFQELIKHWAPERIIVISGNHELIDPDTNMESNISFYRDFFKKLGIIYLQNDLLCIDDAALQSLQFDKEKKLPFILSEEQILEENASELKEKVKNCPLLILGGIGFSGLNEKYNSTNLKYGLSFDSISDYSKREKEFAESEKLSKIYKKLMTCIPDSRLIVLTHMKKENWTNERYNPNWIYVSGHDHRNYYELSDARTIYADNQIGYKRENISLKYFYTDSDYDILLNLEDGIHTITPQQYIDFNRGKRIYSNFSRTDCVIYVLKRDGYYMFFYHGKYKATSKYKKLYLLQGGTLLNLELFSTVDLQYYYRNMGRYVQNIHKLINRYSGIQKKISDFIKSLSGSGYIHGCIIDIEPPGIDGFSYNHLFLNPIDGKVTPYFAYDKSSRTVFKDFRALLENRAECKKLLRKYNMIEKKNPSDLPALRYGDSVEEWGEDNSVYDEGGYLYKMSRIIKSLQYCTDKNCIRIWNENLLDQDLIDNILSSDKESIVLDKALTIIETD